MAATSRTLEHVGEWRVELDADTIEELFTELARIVAESSGAAKMPPTTWEPVAVTGRDMATLLANWANELLGRSETAGRAYGMVRNLRVSGQPDGGAQVTAEIAGQPLNEWVSPLKAATYHELRLERRNGRWRATLLLDV